MIGRRARFEVSCAIRSVGVDGLTPVMGVLMFVSVWTVLVLGVLVVRARVHVRWQRLPPRGKQNRHEHARHPPLHSAECMGRLGCGQ